MIRKVCIHSYLCIYTHIHTYTNTLHVGVRLRATLPNDWGCDHILCAGETDTVSRDASVEGVILEVSQVETSDGVLVSGSTRAGDDKSKDVGEIHVRRFSSQQEVFHSLYEKGQRNHGKVVNVPETTRNHRREGGVQEKEDRRILLLFGGQSSEASFENRRQYHRRRRLMRV